MHRGPASLVAVAVAALLAGCDEPEDRICRQSGQTEVCLVGEPSRYQLEGRGFLPGSDAAVTVGDDGRPLIIQIDRDGRMPSGGGVAGVLGGTRAQEVVVTGSAEGGQPVTFEFAVPADR